MNLGSEISAVVTGGASGLGAATAAELVRAGVKVGILDIDAERGAATAARIGAAYARCDVTSDDSVTQGLAALRTANGQERILVNCAGIAIGKRTVRRIRDTGALEAHDLASFMRVIDINLTGTFRVLAASAAGMMALDPLGPDRERGVIVMTASVAAEDGQIGQVAYSASKGGVAAMTLPIARDLCKDGIRVVSILPGLFSTPMFDGLAEAARAQLEVNVPYPPRLGNPSEYAALARHICENTMLNGVKIRLDGAIRLPFR